LLPGLDPLADSKKCDLILREDLDGSRDFK
jgi:hypothetical protein